MGKNGDCGCGGKVKTVQVPRQPHSAVGERPSMVSAIARAAEILGGDTSAMANSEVIDALCHALVIAREEKQALADALDSCHEEMKQLEDEIAEAMMEEGLEEIDDEKEGD